jgi:hypothetical protein
MNATTKQGLNARTREHPAAEGIWLALAFVVFSVFFAVANINGILFDGLWHDDSFWYYQGTNGNYWLGPSRGRVAALVPANDSLYTWLLTETSPSIARSFYLLLILVSSVLLARAYVRLLQLPLLPAVLAGFLPPLLPVIIIPISLNAAYPVIAILAFSLLTLYFTLYAAIPNKRQISLLKLCLLWLSFWFAIELYLQASPLSLFSVPAIALVLFATCAPTPRLLVLNAISLTVSASASLFRHLASSHRDPTALPIEELVRRIGEFLELSSLIRLPGIPGIWISVALSVFGAVFLFNAYRKYLAGEQAEPLPKIRSLAIAVLPITWAAGTAAPFLVSATFRSYDYVFVVSYGLILGQTCGLWWLLGQFCRMASLGRMIRLGVFACITLIITASDIHEKSENLNRKISRAENTSRTIRAIVADSAAPQSAQFVIVGLKPPHPGNREANSGLIRYVSGRRDLTAIIGPEITPNAPFKKSKNWFDRMKSLRKDRPVLAYRQSSEGNVRIHSMLSADRIEAGEGSEFEWELYELGNGCDLPRLTRSGSGLDAIDTALEKIGLSGRDEVLFAPPSNQRFVRLSEIGLADSAVLNSYSNLIELVALRKPADSERDQSQFVYLRFLSDGPFLGLNLIGSDKETKISLTMSSYARNGDVLEVRLPPGFLRVASELKIQRTDVWPYRML